MAGPGWGGSPPGNEEEARRRIVAATAACVRRLGASATTMQAVADELGITRRTMYRYFPSVEALFAAVGLAALTDFRGRVDEATAGITDAVTLVVESLAFAIEVVPDEPMLQLLINAGRSDLYVAQLVSRDVVTMCRQAVLDGRVDWAVLGYDEAALDDLVTLMLRLFHSFVFVPPDPPLLGTDLRTWLRQWIGPAVLSGGQVGGPRLA
ncbi:TetR/AcrR family transcriptional regulator [Aeromicrobium sp. A1-2]|uniref:TetR/AcrR family transcriptional regulator n=1 Tax=Aeromicrobium sp. A1-2 TaxID=2107713 RepID=UPI0013C2F5AF|nr:TetR/AcrR family transcriptional regulator [Aeromicrobium sp. A1-2]